jgi:phage tail-like protein
MRRQSIERLLPAAYQRAAATPGTVLGALLEVMEELHEPDEVLLENVDDLFAPYRTPDRLAAFLAGWVGLEHLVPGRGPDGTQRLPMPVGRLRNLVAEGAALAQWRGTPYGLRRFLEIACGSTGFEIEEPPAHSFHFVVHVPAEAADLLDLVRRIVEREKPAATTYELKPANAEPASTEPESTEQAT